jgi:hypothetical protein
VAPKLLIVDDDPDVLKAAAAALAQAAERPVRAMAPRGSIRWTGYRPPIPRSLWC